MTVIEFCSIQSYSKLNLTQFSNQANHWIKLDLKNKHNFSKVAENVTEIKHIFI
jgi:hypothetical protein